MYEARQAVKAQVLVDFVIESTMLEENMMANLKWALYVDSLSNGKRSKVGVISKGLNDIVLEYSLMFDFKATNNYLKYE